MKQSTYCSAKAGSEVANRSSLSLDERLLMHRAPNRFWQMHRRHGKCNFFPDKAFAVRQMLTMFFLSLGLSLFGQGEEFAGKSFKMKQNFQAAKCNAVGEIDGTLGILERTFVIVVEKYTGAAYVVSVPKFTSGERVEELNSKFYGVPGVKEVRDSNKNLIQPAKVAQRFYFLIPADDFEGLVEEYHGKGSFMMGIPTVPAKLRFGNGGTGEDPRYFQFEGNLSLGLSIGYKRLFGDKQQFSWNLLTGFTIASVPIDSFNTKGLITTNTTAASFSPHVGLVFDLKNFQFGLYSGIDFLYGEPNKHWVYRNRPWLGIGFGYSLFNTEGKAPSSQ